MGDFNINVLNYDSHSQTKTDHSATIIDNIFSNSLESDTVSGSLLFQISDHFP